jgi:hypothetical protein
MDYWPSSILFLSSSLCQRGSVPVSCCVGLFCCRLCCLSMSALSDVATWCPARSWLCLWTWLCFYCSWLAFALMFMMGLTYVLLCLNVYVSVWMFVWSIACDVMLEMPNKRNLKKVVEQMIRVMPFSGFLVSDG